MFLAHGHGSRGLNDRGQAVGASDAIGGFVLDLATSSVSSRKGSNNRGQITGRCKITGEPGTPFHAFIASPVRDDD
jgi:hypothetical protein